MGQHAEITTKELNIAREDQDKIALASHQNASKALEKGYLKEEIEPLAGIDKDLMVRADTSMEKLASLRPVFDRSEKGTISAGNSSPLTDGASAVMLMSEAAAKEHDLEPLAYIKHYQYAAIDPNSGLLMGPAVAVPKMLKNLGLTLDDFDLIEIHEAFGAQVAANIKAWEEGWKVSESIGKMDYEKLNVNGGSIAIGHPFAATGGRILLGLANEMKRRFVKRGLISICAAGAMAGAMILERE
jgi:acetyl-CoA acetyltransferase family protein